MRIVIPNVGKFGGLLDLTKLKSITKGRTLPESGTLGIKYALRNVLFFPE